MSWRLPFYRVYNLRLALLAYVLVPVVVVVAAAGSWALRLLEEQVNQRMQEDIELIAHAIRLPLSHALERDRRGSIQQALDSAFNIDVVYGAYVYDEDGLEIARSGRGSDTVRTDEAAALAAAGDDLGEFSLTGDEVIFSYFVPLTDTGGRINGLLQVTRRGSDFEDYITMVRRASLGALLGICLLLAALVLFGHYGAVGRHLQHITRGLMKISGGRTDRRLPVQGAAEMQVLAGGINDMLDRINASQQEIAQRQMQETQLRLRLQESEKLAAIGQLASGVAHELGTPLSTVDGKAQQLLRRDDLDPTLRRGVERMRGEAARMEKIIQQLLDYGRRNPLQRVRLDCGAMLRSVLEKAEKDIRSRQIRVELPQPQPVVEVPVDPIRFEQALSNLVFNALQACTSTIRLDWHQSGDQVIISVEDDGAGVDDKHRPYLFDPFFTTKSVGQGTGLGLSVAQAAVNDHQGRIEVDRSPLLGGARFRILLDLQALSEQDG